MPDTGKNTCNVSLTEGYLRINIYNGFKAVENRMSKEELLQLAGKIVDLSAMKVIIYPIRGNISLPVSETLPESGTLSETGVLPVKLIVRPI